MEDVLDIVDPDDGLVDDFDKELMAESENTTPVAAPSEPVKPVVKPQSSYTSVKKKQEQEKRLEESQVMKFDLFQAGRKFIPTNNY